MARLVTGRDRELAIASCGESERSWVGESGVDIEMEADEAGELKMGMHKCINFKLACLRASVESGDSPGRWRQSAKSANSPL